jgi:glutaminase
MTAPALSITTSDTTRANPHLADVEELLALQYSLHLPDRSGAVADYIPELMKVPADQFGIALAAASGEVVAVGDAHAPFTIQSVSKVFTFGMLLDTVGRTETYALVGVQPQDDEESTQRLLDRLLGYRVFAD